MNKMHFTTLVLHLSAFAAIGVNAQNLGFPPQPFYMQQHHADAQKTKELQQLLGQGKNLCFLLVNFANLYYCQPRGMLYLSAPLKVVGLYPYSVISIYPHIPTEFKSPM